MKRLPLLLASVLALAACTGGDEAAAGAAGLQAFDGTVVYVDLEGGFYGIEGGGQFLPTNLPVEVEEDGLPVHVEGRFLDDVATVQMWGRPFEVEAIERR